MRFKIQLLSALLGLFISVNAQYIPQNISKKIIKEAELYAENTYNKMSQEERIGQLFIVSLYTNKGEDFIQNVRNQVVQEHIGGLILMQEDAHRQAMLINEFQDKAEVPLMIGIDAEWGLYQRFSIAYKYPWAITLGAIQDNHLIYEMSSKIAEDCKRMGINWNFAPVVDVNTNPANPIIGNRSFGSEIQNVIAKGYAYAKGLQEHGVMASLKHFPGHGDTDKDSHLDLPVVTYDTIRLNRIELAPFRALTKDSIGGIMVAHLYVPALEKEKNIPASLSKNIVTDLLKNKYHYKGLVITDALNMNAVAKKFSAGEIDLRAFRAGNDLMLFSQDVKTSKKLIAQALQNGTIPESRLKESVIKILKTKYLLGLTHFKPIDLNNIPNALNNHTHKELVEKLYAHAITLIKNQNNLIPLDKAQIYYYLPLEEAPYQVFYQELKARANVKLISPKDIDNIPKNAVVLIGLHKDNSTAYKPYKISEKSKAIIRKISSNHATVLDLFGSPYALKDLDISNVSGVVVSYENNTPSMRASARALAGETTIEGRLSVLVNSQLPAGSGITLNPKNK
ncbi:glycoside hydrolase family 3 protein [Riemerella columbipharyngis]|uniref:beta-N-acetylhexosaminidase n=1 Tax=Riemerella columbipharyngis TaxID=1071918 RepID=A0A1G7DIZ4_9FLAO|nr:glycoside hydrolase family 3 protein [Riemerella columbipharyngis]SDE51518.1 beta-glucosidase [Riemerella columbipharyngis]